MKFSAKEEGAATIPILGMLIVLSIIITIVYITYVESKKINERTDDAVTMSIQGVCLFDRYEYATGALDGRDIICFYPGTSELRYSDVDHSYNMEVTKAACEYAYMLYKDVLKENISAKYVVLPAEASGGIGRYVKKFEMVNVRDGVAYVYDYIGGTTTFIPAAEGMKSTLEVSMEMNMVFPLYGEKVISFSETGKLESRVN